jgi:arsenite methyltransferase
MMIDARDGGRADVMNRETLSTPEALVYDRYSGAAHEREAELCCPSTYDPRYLEVLPREILERDYGCGDPTQHLRSGEVVLDLGSGGGKACYIAAQIVGPEGHVIGVDCNQEMLALARRHQRTVAERLGYANVEFRCGLIQDLRLDLDLLARELDLQPVRDQGGWLELRTIEERLRRDHPLVPDESVDCVISNCVLNLVRTQDRAPLFAEIFRVLRGGGRVAISDIVADEDVPEHLRRDPQLWSGCISGAYREDRFLKALEDAGFHGVRIARRPPEPWRTVEGIEFRSLTVLASKGKQGPCLDRNQAVVYKGPFKKVEDDDGHVYRRGERMAVCDKTFHRLGREPYAGMFEPVEPRVEVPLEAARAFDCRRSALRHPRETKGADYRETTGSSDSRCGSGGSCC